MARRNNIARQECYNCNQLGHLSVNCALAQRAERCGDCNRVGSHRQTCPQRVVQALVVAPANQQASSQLVPAAPITVQHRQPVACAGCGRGGHAIIRCPTVVAVVHLADRRAALDSALERYDQWETTMIEFSVGMTIRSSGEWAMAPFEIWNAGRRVFYRTSFNNGRMSFLLRHNRNSERIIMAVRQQDRQTTAKIIVSAAANTVNRRLVMSSTATVNWATNRAHIGNGEPNLRVAGNECPRLYLRRYGRRLQVNLNTRGGLRSFAED